MPPKVKITKEGIIHTALDIVRESGAEALNARAVAAKLGCSTQPVFSNFSNMEELLSAVIGAAYELYLGFLKSEAEKDEYPRYKAFGMAYIRFATEEKELFKLLFMRDRRGESNGSSPDFEESVKMLMQNNNMTKESATKAHLELWSLVHGIATMQATSFLEFSTELVSDMISDVYKGICCINTAEV